MYLKIKTYLKMKYEKYFKESKDGIYLFAYAFMLLSEIWDVSAASHNPFRYTFTSTVLLLVYEYLTGSRKSFIITAFFTAGIFSLIWLKVPIISKNMFLCMLFVYTARKINFERIGKFTLFFYRGSSIIYCILRIHGILAELLFYRQGSDGNGIWVPTIFAGLFDEYYNACCLLISQRYEA